MNTVISLNHDYYSLWMMDGYISSDILKHTTLNNTDSSIENKIASMFYDQVNKLAKLPSRISPAHVWVVGSNNWLRQYSLPDLINSITEGDCEPNYRMAILGFPKKPDLSPSQLSRLGIIKNKTHSNPHTFWGNCGTILNSMYARYQENTTAPSIELDHLAVPYVFYGHDQNGILTCCRKPVSSVN